MFWIHEKLVIPEHQELAANPQHRCFNRDTAKAVQNSKDGFSLNAMPSGSPVGMKGNEGAVKCTKEATKTRITGVSLYASGRQKRKVVKAVGGRIGR